ncbi:MAG: efflux RND transporter periplasmic adaptor subunit [Pseudomonadota bacterium]
METHDLSKLKIDAQARITRKERSQARTIIKWCIAITLLVGGIFAGLLHWGILMPPVEVQVIKVGRVYPSTPLTVLNAGGYVVAQRKAAVSSKATGRLSKLMVEEGQSVKSEDIIAQLENRDLGAVLDEARAGVRVAEAMLRNAEAELQDALLNYNRSMALRHTGAVSLQSHDTVEARHKKAAASERSARFSLEKAHAGLRVAEVNLEYSLIRAPFDGVILTKNADEGEVVAPFGGALNAKAAVVTMADMNSLMVEVDVAESNLEKVRVGGPCEIRLDALPNDRFSGFVHMIVPTADRAKATVLTKVKFRSKDDRILPEMSAKAAFLSRELKDDEREAVIAVPVAALAGTGDSTFVCVVRDRRAERVPVVVGRRWGDMVEIVSGLKEDERAVLNPDEKVTGGAAVKVAG